MSSPTKIQNFAIIKKLGEGGYGSVYLCRDKLTGKEYAVKHIEIDKNGIPSIIEANIMATIDHPHITQSHAVLSDEKKLYIFQESGKCDLNLWCKKRKNLPSPQLLREWSFSIVQALACLHQRNIVHGDVKASNILLFDDNKIKLSDFSLSQKKWKDGSKFKHKPCTCTHRPPEAWMGLEWDFSVDIWALGCTLFEMAYGEYLFPYQGWEETKIPRTLLTDRYLALFEDFATNGPNGYQENYTLPHINRKPLYKTFRIPNNYYSTEYSLFNTLMMSMLCINPQERPTISEILKHPYFADMSPVAYRTMNASEEEIAPDKEERYMTQLKRYTVNQEVIDLTLSLIGKIKYLHFKYPDFDNNHLKLLGAYWIASKIVIRRPPTIPYPAGILHKIEKKICLYLSFRLFS